MRAPAVVASPAFLLAAGAVLATCALLAGPASADEGERALRLHAAASLRAVAERGTPATAVRYDPGRDAFTLSDYLAPGGPRSFASLLASLGLEGRHLDGDLRWVLTADTGELRRERAHRVGAACWSDVTDSGLARPGSGDCSLYRLTPRVWSRVSVPVEETALEEHAKITSNGRPFGDELRQTLLLREAYAAYRVGRAGFLSLTVGRKRMVVGDGYVHDDYATGVVLDADVGAIGPRWGVSAAVFQPTRDLPGSVDELSPMFLVQVEYLPSLFERAGLFVAGLRERSDGLASVFRGAVEERLVVAAEQSAPGTQLHRRANQLLAAASAATLRSDGALGWLGTSGKLTPGKGHRLAWTAAFVGGTIRSVDAGRRGAAVAEDVAVRGGLASLRWEVELGRGLTGGASLLALSGDSTPRAGLDADGRLTPATGTYRVFMGVSPFLTEASIFFGGGLAEGYADRQVRAPGVNGRGVVAPALSLRWAPGERLAAHARTTWLQAAVEGPFGGRRYGVEVDLDASWEATPWLSLGAEADALFPGDFFRGREPITRVTLALDVLTP